MLIDEQMHALGCEHIEFSFSTSHQVLISNRKKNYRCDFKEVGGNQMGTKCTAICEKLEGSKWKAQQSLMVPGTKRKGATENIGIEGRL